MLRLSVMKQVIRVIFRVAGAVAFVVLINPLKSAVAEEVKVVPAATAALPNSKSGWYVTAGAGTSWESSINTSRTSSLYAPNLGSRLSRIAMETLSMVMASPQKPELATTLVIDSALN